jgi:hypothetical protein
VDSLDLGVVGEGVLAALATKTGLLEATEGHLGVELVVAVDPDGAGLELVGDGDGAGDVLGEDGGGEAVEAVVGLAEDVGFVGELGDDDDGAEDLLLHDPCIRLNVCN